MSPEVSARVDSMLGELGLDRRRSLIPPADAPNGSAMARVVEVARELFARARS
jgi:hypothetical protein